MTAPSTAGRPPSEASASPPLLLEEHPQGVIWLRLNRPAARNGLSLELMQRLQAELDRIAAEPRLRVVVIAANGPAFCSGHDLRELLSQSDPAFYETVFGTCSQMMLSVMRLPKPVIAAVHGVATAAGCQLVASCDLAIATETARFATPGVNIGLFCSTPMVALSRNVGRKQAMEMLLTGDLIDAEQALQFGLINRVVPEAELEPAVEALAQKLLGKSAYTLAVGKAAFYQQLEAGVSDAYAATSAVMVQNMLADDAHEGIRAFLEKRQPVWVGH